MKIVTWNCGGGLRTKCAAIDGIGADLLVIQECEDPARSTSQAYRNWAGYHLWHGSNKDKGIGVFLRTNESLSLLDWDDQGLQSFLPCVVANRFILVAVWTKQANSPNFRYIGQLWKYLQLHKCNLTDERFIICGDLNSNKRWDEWDRWWNHSDVVRELEEIRCKSIYHSHFMEAQGSESRPTLYHRKNPSKPYHVDYAFASESLLCDFVDVGNIEDWIAFSDHMPLAFSIAS